MTMQLKDSGKYIRLNIAPRFAMNQDFFVAHSTRRAYSATMTVSKSRRNMQERLRRIPVLFQNSFCLGVKMMMAIYAEQIH